MSISKPLSDRDASQVLQSSYNSVNDTLGVDGFLVAKVGNSISLAITTTTLANDTEIYSFYDNGTLLYVLTIVYTDGTRSLMLTATRTA